MGPSIVLDSDIFGVCISYDGLNIPIVVYPAMLGIFTTMGTFHMGANLRGRGLA